MNLGANVRRIRRERGWTQHELASRTGITQPSISDIERGKCCPQIGKLISLSFALGTPIESLVLDQLPPR